MPSSATEALVVVQKVSGRRRKMRVAMPIVVGWKSALATDPAAPAPRLIALAVAVVAAALGQSDVFAAALLAFVGIIRIGEPLGLLVRDLAPAEQDLSEDLTVVILARGKNIPGETERIIIWDRKVMQFVRCYLARHVEQITVGLGFPPHTHTFRSHTACAGEQRQRWCCRAPQWRTSW